MHRLIVLIFFVLVQVSCYSQQQYQSAYVILQNGDSLSGFISNKNLSNKKLRFKKTGERNFTVFGVDEVVRFVLSDNSKYESHVVKYDGDNQHANKLPYGREPNELTEERIFLEVITKGTVSLFEFADSNERIHFVISKDGVLTELLNRTFLDGKLGLVVNKKYIGQLRAFLVDCRTSIIKDNLRYQRKSLFSLMNSYYSCIGIKPNAEINGEVKLKVGLAMGLFSETQKYVVPQEYHYNYLDGGKLSLQGNGFHTGLSFEVGKARPFNRYTVSFELNYKHFKSTSDLPSTISSIELQILPRFNYLIFHNKLIFWNVGGCIFRVFSSEIDTPNSIESVFENQHYTCAGLVGGIGFYPVRRDKIEISLECRAKYGRIHQEFTYENTFSSVGFVINVIPKFK